MTSFPIVSEPAIRIRGLGKRYKLGLTHTGSIRDAVNGAAGRIFGRRQSEELSDLSTGKDRTSDDDYFWALRDIDLDIQPGEVVGIIGKNGAGKSTLLKLLSRITTPTTGEIQIRGRVASLLEVGTGFHPELTGRENVYLNGTILGMTKAEVDRQFDAIVDFAGVEKFIDTPVKRYSSGMTVRLGFAVAAHLDPEILIVDEVLAVGDVEFQRKCLKTMKGVANSGKTVLFVSHNMTAIRNLCQSCVLMDNGSIVAHSSVEDVVQEYFAETTLTPSRIWTFQPESSKSPVVMRSASIAPLEKSSNHLQADWAMTLTLEFEQHCHGPLDITLHVCDLDNTVIFSTSTVYDDATPSASVGRHIVSAVFPPNLFCDRQYRIHVLFVDSDMKVAHREDSVVTYEVHDLVRPDRYFGKRPGYIRQQVRWIVGAN